MVVWLCEKDAVSKVLVIVLDDEAGMGGNGKEMQAATMQLRLRQELLTVVLAMQVAIATRERDPSFVGME